MQHALLRVCLQHAGQHAWCFPAASNRTVVGLLPPTLASTHMHASSPAAPHNNHHRSSTQLHSPPLHSCTGDMITEEALPTYMAMLNTLDGVRDETGAAPTPWAQWTRLWTAEENRHGDLMSKYIYLTGRSGGGCQSHRGRGREAGREVTEAREAGMEGGRGRMASQDREGRRQEAAAYPCMHASSYQRRDQQENAGTTSRQ